MAFMSMERGKAMTAGILDKTIHVRGRKRPMHDSFYDPCMERKMTHAWVVEKDILIV